MVNTNIVISVAAVLVALIVTLALMLSLDGDGKDLTIRVTGSLNSKASGKSLDSQMYYCAGAHCNYYGADVKSPEDWPGYLALVGFQSGGDTFLTEFSIGYTFKFNAAGELQSCIAIPDADQPSVADVASTFTVDSAAAGSDIALGNAGDSFTVGKVEQGSSEVKDASVFGFKIPTPIECATATANASASRRLEERRLAEANGERQLATVGYDNWMLAFYTYKTKSGIPNSIDFWAESANSYDGWNVAEFPAVEYTETWKDLPFFTTMMEGFPMYMTGVSKPDQATGWASAPTKTLTKTVTEGKCENGNSYAKIWVKGNDITIGFAGTDVFVLSFNAEDIKDIMDDMNGWPVDHPSGHTFHAGFAEYVDRIDDCLDALLTPLKESGKTVKYVVGHSLGGASANIWPLYHPKWKPTNGVYTYGAPITTQGQSCEVDGMRYFNENDSVASLGVPGVLDFKGFSHNMKDAKKLFKGSVCTWKTWVGCLAWSETREMKEPIACSEDTGSSCWWVGDCVYNLATSHLAYNEWNY